MIVEVAETVDPVSTPVTFPPPTVTVAILVVLLVQVPNGDASLSKVLKPWHTLRLPRIGPGNGLTVTTAVAIQPVPKAYVMIAVDGAMRPVTRPVPLTEALPGALLLQVPPPVASLNCVVKLRHTESVPSIAVGFGFTVTTTVL